jgi:hypothetical protein
MRCYFSAKVRQDWSDIAGTSLDLAILSTHCAVLDDSGKVAFQTYLDMGGNFIGVHAASDCLRNTSSYRSELGTSPPLSSY